MHSRTLSGNPGSGFAPLAAFLLLVACATQQAIAPVEAPRMGSVAMTAVAGDDAGSYPTQPSEKYDLPQPFEENAAPAYPPELLAENLPPVQVRVRVIVDEHGVVTDSSALQAPPNYPQFFAAVQAVVRQWKYWPLVRIVPSDRRTDIVFNGYVSTYDGTATALPFHQDYDFTFTQRDGQGIVTSVAPATTK